MHGYQDQQFFKCLVIKCNITLLMYVYRYNKTITSQCTILALAWLVYLCLVCLVYDDT